MRRALRVLPVLLIATATLARADGGPILHEYVPDVAEDEGSMLVSSGGAQPDAIVYQGEVLPAPEGGALAADERPMRGGDGDGNDLEEPGRRSPTFAPDRVTDLNGSVGYYTVFTPTIAPFKRITALDRVVMQGNTPILAIASRDRTAEDIVGADARAPDARPRDRFWGSVVLDFEEGDAVPFPSVAPESRVLTLSTDPPTGIAIERDRADNLYAVAPSGVRGAVRAVFLMDAPRTYFGQPLGSGAVDALRGRVPDVPEQVRGDALAFATELGLDASTDFDEALSTLTEYFRGFEESSDYPRDTGNIFLDLVRSRRGICRHRAYGFVILAHALGMHARFVMNEAHAWVEVERPDGGWLRVDLGGAATGLEARGGGDRPRYDPGVRDPLPRPPAYEAAYERARQMAGLRPRESSGGGAGEGAGSSAGSGGGSGAGSGSGAGGGVASRPPDAELSTRGFLSLELDAQRYEVFRGRELEVTGRARGGGSGVPDLRIMVWLRAQRGEREWLLGETVTGESGLFRGVFGVPLELPVGDYDLWVRHPGDDTWGPAAAR